MSDFVIDTIKSTGYFGILFLMLAENVFPPIPSEVIMPLAGYLVSKESMNMIMVVAAGTVGTMLGAYVLYFVGAKMGKDRLTQWSEKYGRWFAITPKDIDKTQHWFDKHGSSTVLFCRLIPGMRSLISVPAGLVEMPLLKFSLYTLIGTIAWTSLLAYIGLVLGQEFEQAKDYIGPVSTAVVIGLLGFYLYRVIRGAPDQ
ncbi:Inner membrane protein YqjA [Thalassocella blandensis]|nr:Inner membrane protein YqjA [Thalassocella blandensis]